MLRISKVDEQLKELEVCTRKLLTIALKYSTKVAIISNSETGWVRLSAQKFMPSLLPLLEKCKVISARSEYEKFYPHAPLKWKFCAFQNILTGNLQNVISFGDSPCERDAIRAVTRGLEGVKTKSVKFVSSPSLEQLQREQEFMTKYFDYVCNHDDDLDLMLTIKMLN